MANENTNTGATAGGTAAQNVASNTNAPTTDQNPSGDQIEAAAVNVDAFEKDELVDLGDGKLSWQELVEAGKERLKNAKKEKESEQVKIDPRDQAILGLTKEVFEMKAEKAIQQYPNASIDEIRRRLLDLPPEKRDLKRIPEIAKKIHDEIEEKVAKRYEQYLKEKTDAAKKNLSVNTETPIPSSENNKPITLDDTLELQKRIRQYLKKE